jgi:hypothetical protein
MNRFLVCALVTASTILSAAQKSEKVSVFVRSAVASGFTDPSRDRSDSIKDLVKKLKGSDTLRPADSEQDATLILEVLDRETKRESNAWTAFGGHRQNKSYLTVRLIAGEFSTEFSGESGSRGVLKGYGAAAGKVVDQLEDWVKANREKLATLKKP